MHLNKQRIQKNNLGFIDTVGNVLTKGADIATKGLEVAQQGKNIYQGYQTVFNPQPNIPAGTPDIYTAAPYGGLPSATYVPPIAFPAAQTGAPTLDSAGVMKLQKALAKLGYNPGPADGIFGAMTENAVRQYQNDRGLTPVDGRATQFVLASAQADVQKMQSAQKQSANGATGQTPAWLLPALGAGALFLFMGR